MLDASSFQSTCPRCGDAFVRHRPNKTYCTPKCAKAATRNASRGPRTVAESVDLRARARAHNARARELAEWLYTAPVGQRLGIMADLIAAALEGDAMLRNIFTDPRLLFASPITDRRLFFRRAPGSYRTIAQAADAYCRKFWGQGVREVISGGCPHPPTGEGNDVVGHSPQAASGSAPVAPDGWDFRVHLNDACKGLLWLPASRTKLEKWETTERDASQTETSLRTCNGGTFRGTSGAPWRCEDHGDRQAK